MVVHSLAIEAHGHSKRWTMTSLAPGVAVEASASSVVRTTPAASRAAASTAVVAAAAA